MKVLHVVGARPNFMKVAPVWKAIAAQTEWQQCLVHTGQHYDVKMSDVFFNELALPAPDHYLGVGSASHAKQTAAVMVAFEQVVTTEKPDWVMVYGDVNSTVAAALVCAKLLIPVAHVEAGLRSFDRTMPEEINRLVTDQIANLLLTPSPDADENLQREGVDGARIHRVGNVMIDSLVQVMPVAERSTLLEQLSLTGKAYGVVTLHRPFNVDNRDTLLALLTSLQRMAQEMPLVFPVHPRTRQQITSMESALDTTRLILIEPLGYIDFLRLISKASVVVTDSGGIQEETSYLNVPCLTLRPNTERPITVSQGTNQLIGSDLVRLQQAFAEIVRHNGKQEHRPPIPLWDGKASDRIVQVLNTTTAFPRQVRRAGQETMP